MLTSLGEVLVRLFAPAYVFAQEGLVPCNGPDCDLRALVGLGDNIINWLIWFGVIIAVLTLVYAGFKLVVSGGDEHALTHAKEMIWNVLIGFVIVLAAYLIVDIFMLTLTGKGLSGWQLQGNSTQQSTTASTQQGTQSQTTAGSGTCTNCVGITAKNATCKTQSSCTITPEYNNRLSNLSTDVIITEGYPPTRTHQAACHTNGTCTDVVFADRNFTSQRISAFQSEAASAGFRAVYEPGPGGSCTGISNCLPNSTTRATGDHFSLYME